MNPYTLALFVHVSGAIGIFGGLSALVFGVAALRRAQRVEDVRFLAALIIASGNIAVASIVILGIAGFYMALTAWGIEATWIIVATVSFIVLAPWGMLVVNPRVRAIAKHAREAPDGPMPDGLAQRTRDPLLGISVSMYIACLFGIVFLMTNKPAVSESILAMLVAVALGLVVSLPFWRSRTKERIT
ncbi:MAG TPA: DUF2269 family protein [Ktedonobacterales bacterium]|nr:DUF2269 family protein [Ktedonobacterales bacterium]